MVIKYFLLFSSLFFLKPATAQTEERTEKIRKGHAYNMAAVLNPDQMPDPGYDLKAYFEKNMHYPKRARKRCIEGEVLIGLVVYDDGTINNIFVRRSLGSGCDKEAVRLIKNMPPWKPGRIKGQIVFTYIKQTVIFKLKE